jgi:hypothetical protein
MIRSKGEFGRFWLSGSALVGQVIVVELAFRHREMMRLVPRTAGQQADEPETANVLDLLRVRRRDRHSSLFDNSDALARRNDSLDGDSVRPQPATAISKPPIRLRPVGLGGGVEDADDLLDHPKCALALVSASSRAVHPVMTDHASAPARQQICVSK